jgi:hypothetical protein
MNTTLPTSTALTLPGRRFVLAAVLMFAAEASSAGWFGPPPPVAAAAYATQAVSKQGAYRVSYKTEEGGIPINRLHSWTLHIGWVMDFAIASGAQKDTVRFNLRLQK